MTAEDIKRTHSMRDILTKYSIGVNRSGFAQCPFHKGDRTPSMKVYKDSYHCFGCGANGDIFKFIMDMDNCDFKTAFYSLGGTYANPTFESKLAIYRQQKKVEEKRKRKEELRKKLKMCNALIDVCRDKFYESEPLSDEWAFYYNQLQYQLYVHSILSEEVFECR